jgi:hypothetical protein
MPAARLNLGWRMAGSKLHDDIGASEAAFRVRKLKYGGYEVLAERDPEMPHRHVCDFRSEYEARAWVEENALASARMRRPD